MTKGRESMNDNWRSRCHAQRWMLFEWAVHGPCPLVAFETPWIILGQRVDWLHGIIKINQRTRWSISMQRERERERDDTTQLTWVVAGVRLDVSTKSKCWKAASKGGHASVYHCVPLGLQPLIIAPEIMYFMDLTWSDERHLSLIKKTLKQKYESRLSPDPEAQEFYISFQELCNYPMHT